MALSGGGHAAGGLRVDWLRFGLDWATLGICWMAWLAQLRNDSTETTWTIFGCIVLATLIAAVTIQSLTNRWPLVFPLIPFFVVQVIVLCWVPLWRIFWASLAFLCLLVASLLVYLFPALALPPTNGPYHVGRCDFYLDRVDGQPVWVRLLYPTTESPQHLPYLSVPSAYLYCRHSMKFGAPPPLDRCGWMLHTLRLVTRRERPGAKLLERVDKNHPQPLFPVVVYSHGLGGHADIYSFQTHSLAAQGNIVLVVTHADGSSPAVAQPDGTIITYDYDTGNLECKRSPNTMDAYVTYVHARRQQTEHRVQDVWTAVQALQAWNKTGVIPTKDKQWSAALSHLPSLQGRLDMNHLTLMGHSFGAATVLSTAFRHPEHVHTVIAHEYAMDWVIPEASASLLHKSRIDGLSESKLYDTLLYGENDTKYGDKIYSMFHCLLLFSDEWVQKRRYLTPLLHEMNQKKRFGDKISHNLWEYHVIDGLNHQGFSDQPMLTPTWLGRSVGLTGIRNPVDCSYEVAKLTQEFLVASRQIKKAK